MHLKDRKTATQTSGPGRWNTRGSLYPKILAKQQPANAHTKYQTQTQQDSTDSQPIRSRRNPRSKGRAANKSARSSRSRSSKAKNILVLDQISRGNIVGRNNNLPQVKTCQEKRYRIDYGPEFRDSLCENLDDSTEFEKKMISQMDDEMASRSVDTQPGVHNIDCNLNKRKQKQMYSFSRNIDYSQITKTQINKFLNERKKPTSVGYSPKRSENQFQKAGTRIYEKENNIEMQQQGYQTEVDPKTVQILQSSKSHNTNNLNSTNQRIHLIKHGAPIREPLSKKYGSNLHSKQPTKGVAKTPRDGGNCRPGSTFGNSKYQNKGIQKPPVMKSARANNPAGEPETVEDMMKKLTYQYSLTTARIENFKLMGLATSKQSNSRNQGNMPQSTKSLKSMPSTQNANEEGRQSNLSQGKSQQRKRSENRGSQTQKKSPQIDNFMRAVIASKHPNPGAHNSRNPFEGKPWDRLNTVQINLVPEEEDERIELSFLPSDKKKLPFGRSSVNSNRSNRSSCNEEKITQRSSVPEKPSTGFRNEESTRSGGHPSVNFGKDDHQYEKHKIWCQSQIEKEGEVGPTQESVFDQAALNMMTFIEKGSEPKLNKFDLNQIQPRAQARAIIETSNEPIEEGANVCLRKPNILVQNCQKGPQRVQKQKKTSTDNTCDNECADESRATAKFTNQSITDIESMEIEEYSQDTREDVIFSTGKKMDLVNCQSSQNQRSTLINGSNNKSNHFEKDKLENLIGKTTYDFGQNERKPMVPYKSGEINCKEKLNKLDLNQISLPEFGDDTDDPISNFEISSQQNQEDLNSSWEKAQSDIVARKIQLQQQKNNINNQRQQSQDFKANDKNAGHNHAHVEQFQIQHISEGERAAPLMIDSKYKKINFVAIYHQIGTIKQIRDLLEVRPSQQAQRPQSIDYSSGKQAIEGLSFDERQRIKQLCQEWWDSSNEDNSFFRMAVIYQCEATTSGSHGLGTGETQLKTDFQSFASQGGVIDKNSESSCCMRKCAILQSIIIGMTAFYSMLTRGQSPDENLDIDLDMRQLLHSLMKMVYDQTMLSLSFALGKLSSFSQVTKNTDSYEYRLHQQYSEFIHLLFINKKIESEDDYQIFNTRGQYSDKPQSSYVTNQVNRDCQLNKISKRLIEKICKIIDFEINIQNLKRKKGNANLLQIIKNVASSSATLEFQEAKNTIYEGISASDVMPKGPDVGQTDHSNCNSEPQVMENPSSLQNYQKNNYGVHLIKTFKDDVNQIIQEESREDSMSVSNINSSRVPEDFNSNSNDTKSKYNSHSRRHIDPSSSQRGYIYNATPEKQHHDKIFLLQDNDSVDQIRKKYDDSGQRSLRDLSLSKEMSIGQEDQECSGINNLSNARIIRVSYLSHVDQKPIAPFLPPLKAGMKFTLVLDLDETLIHCAPFNKKDDNQLELFCEEDMIVYDRPGLQEFLQDMKNYFEIVVFTAGGKAYAQKIVSQCLEPLRGPGLIDHVLFWEHVTIISDQEAFNMQQRLSRFYSGLSDSRESLRSNEEGIRFKSINIKTKSSFDEANIIDSSSGYKDKKMEFDVADEIQDTCQDQCYIKDLSKLGRDLKNLIIVDNLPENFAWQLRNGICIKEFRVENQNDPIIKNDQALLHLSQLLKSIYDIAIQQPRPDLRLILQDQLQEYRKKQENIYFV